MLAFPGGSIRTACTSAWAVDPVSLSALLLVLLEMGLETMPLLATSGALSSGLLLSPPLPAPLPVPLGASLLELGPEPVPLLATS